MLLESFYFQALEIQGKHSEAAVELFKICVIHQIFPPEEFSVRLLFILYFGYVRVVYALLV